MNSPCASLFDFATFIISPFTSYGRWWDPPSGLRKFLVVVTRFCIQVNEVCPFEAELDRAWMPSFIMNCAAVRSILAFWLDGRLCTMLMYSRKACYLDPKKTAPATMTPSTPALNFCRLVLFLWSCWWRNFSWMGRSYTIITKPLLPSQKWLLCSFKQSDCARKPHRDLMRSYSYIRETQNPATVYFNNNSISDNLFRLVVPLFLHNASLLIFSLFYLTIIKKKSCHFFFFFNFTNTGD